MQYRLRGFDPGPAAVVERLEEAASEAAARAQASAQGLVVLGLERTANRKATASTFALQRDTDFKVGWWCRELRTLLRAGMTVVEALETLVGPQASGRRTEVQQALLSSLQQGQALSSAMQSVPGGFPAVLVASV